MSVYIARLRMSSGGNAQGQPWTHTFAVQTDLSLSSEELQGNVEDLITTLFKPLYPTTVFFDDLTLSDLAKNVPGEESTEFTVFPLSFAGLRAAGDADNDRTALETCLIVKAYSGNKRASPFWLRGALFESEVLFSASGGWAYDPPSTGQIPALLAAIDLSGLALVPGKVNMKTRDASSFKAWTLLKMGGIRARQVHVQKKAPPPKNERSAIDRLESILPLAASVVAFILTKGKAGLSPAAKASIISTAGGLGTIVSSILDNLVDPTPD